MERCLYITAFALNDTLIPFKSEDAYSNGALLSIIFVQHCAESGLQQVMRDKAEKDTKIEEEEVEEGEVEGWMLIK